MSYSQEQLEEIRARLRELQPQSQQGSTQQAVDVLRKEIQEARRRGISLDQIAGAITAGGVKAATTTLKTYIKRSSAAGDKGAKRKRASGDAAGTQREARRQSKGDAFGDSEQRNRGTFTVRQDSADI